MSDREKFMSALARNSVGQIPVADQTTHERIAQETVAANPELVRRTAQSGNYIPLIRAAKERGGAVKLVDFWLAQRLGQLVREQEVQQ